MIASATLDHVPPLPKKPDLDAGGEEASHDAHTPLSTWLDDIGRTLRARYSNAGLWLPCFDDALVLLGGRAIQQIDEKFHFDFKLPKSGTCGAPLTAPSKEGSAGTGAGDDGEAPLLLLAALAARDLSRGNQWDFGKRLLKVPAACAE